MNENLFDTVASGLQSLCEDKKQQFITKNEKCLRRTLDKTSQQCEQKCHFIQALADFSHRSDLKGLGIVHLLELLENLGQVCRSDKILIQNINPIFGIKVLHIVIFPAIGMG
jgi:hypothetical protein